MNSNHEYTADRREESINLDLNASTFSEINMRNVSFYSYNDHVGNDFRYTTNMNDFAKSKSDKRMEIDSFKMLPYYIEKVSKNIQYLDDLIKKQNPETSNALNNSTAGPVIENINSLIKKSVESVNEVLASNKLTLDNIDKKKPVQKSGNLSMDAKSLLKLTKTGNKFDVIDEKDEDAIAKKEMSMKGMSLNMSRNMKKMPISSSVKKFSVTSAKTNLSKSGTANAFNTNNSMQSKYKTTNTSITGNSSASKQRTSNVIKKPAVSVRPDLRSSGLGNYKTYQTVNTVSSKDSSMLKKNLNSSRLSSQLNNKNKTLADQRQRSMSDMRNNFNTTEKLNPRRVFSPALPSRSQMNQKLLELSSKKPTSKATLAVGVKNNPNHSILSTNQSINLGNKLTGKCNCVCTCNSAIKNIQNSNANNNTTAITETNSKSLTTTIPQFNVNDNQTEIKNHIKKFYAMHLINMEYSAIKLNHNSKYDTKLTNFIKNSLKVIEEETETNNKQNLTLMGLSANYNSNNSNSGMNAPGDRRKELNKRRDEIKVVRIVQIQRKWREYSIKKNFALNIFSLKSQIKSETIKSCKEKIYSSLTENTQEKLKELNVLMIKANEIWNEINENSTNNIIFEHLTNDFGYDFISQNANSLNNFYFGCLSKILTDNFKLIKDVNVVNVVNEVNEVNISK